MTKRERVIAAIEGKKVDAIPSSFLCTSQRTRQ